MNRISYWAVFFVLTILTSVMAQNSDDNKNAILIDFLQQIENQCSKSEQCEFTDQDIEQILQDCQTATQHLNSAAYPNLELCQKYELSDIEIESLLNQYITYLENNSDGVQPAIHQNNPYVMILKQ